MLKHVQYPKNKIIKFIREYEDCLNELYKELPLPIYNKIVATGIKGKLNKLTVYAKNMQYAKKICKKIVRKSYIFC
jgi:hypothetical protein